MHIPYPKRISFQPLLSLRSLLSFTFFLCLIPVLFYWFGLGGSLGLRECGLRGISILGPIFYLAVILYYYAILGKSSHILILSSLAHFLLECSYCLAFVRWPIVANIETSIDLSLSWRAVQPGFWISISAGILHYIVFLITIMKYKSNAPYRKKAGLM